MYDKSRIYRIGVMCLCAAVGSYILYTCLSSRGSAPAGGNGERAAQQINRSEELNRQAGAEIGTAGDAAGRAEQHAERAAELNQSAQTRVSDCQKLIGELKADNRRAKQLLDELIGEHRAGEATDAAH